ncbi:MAG: Spermine synthase [Candidatus Ozemobacter sibiricus]|uniref:Spermine synthase n=1 Tax=Candidatus Ozemobacter sibiricus TaxID=2268124 RepID=A0A367ZKA9_9BACT|nr:MAG: Spermine synthase [Candidatus Ozemobacter sibiricus]
MLTERTILAMSFLLGFWANLAQVAVLRLFLGQFYGTEIQVGLFLGVWLAGVALGGLLGGWRSPRAELVLGLMAVAPLVVLGVFAGGITALPARRGAFLPTWPVLGFLGALVLPLAVPVGLVLPAVLRRAPVTNLGEAYGSEALGSFAGGVVFSLLLGGSARAIPTLAALPVLPLAAAFLVGPSRRARRGLACLLAAWGPVVALNLPGFERWAEERAWDHFHPGYRLETTLETPYQRVQVGEYHGQRSLFINGSFAAAWPDPVRAGERVHPFLTACLEPRRILIVGAPTPDLVEQVLAWPDLRLTVADLDADLLRLLLGDRRCWKPEAMRRASEGLSSPSLEGAQGQILAPATRAGDLGRSESERPPPDRATTTWPAGTATAQVEGRLACPGQDTCRLEVRAEDPRGLARANPGAFDGILVLPADPTTLTGNRLFTQEGFADLAQGLATAGVLAVGVTGTENYLGPDLETIILSTHRALQPSFPEIFAVPGDPITFWAARRGGVLATDPARLQERYRARGPSGASFRPEAFANLLLPFRVEEVQSWLARDTAVPRNTDLHPQAFARQLKLWDIYSGSSLSFLFRWVEALTLSRALVGLVVLAFGLAIAAWLAEPHRGRIALLTVGVSISGAGGLLAEIVLLLVYQSRQGAMFRMAALFFGLYMLGLATGAWLGRRLGFATPARLRALKGAQVGMVGICLGLLRLPAWQTGPVIGAGIFLVAFLDGIEFPAVDVLLGVLGLPRERRAGWLIFADNFGALWVGLVSGWWILPVVGLEGGLWLLAAALGLNFLALWPVPFPLPPTGAVGDDGRPGSG